MTSTSDTGALISTSTSATSAGARSGLVSGPAGQAGPASLQRCRQGQSLQGFLCNCSPPLVRSAFDAQQRQPGTGSTRSRVPGLRRVLNRHSRNTACSVLSAEPSNRWWNAPWKLHHDAACYLSSTECVYFLLNTVAAGSLVQLIIQGQEFGGWRHIATDDAIGGNIRAIHQLVACIVALEAGACSRAWGQHHVCWQLRPAHVQGNPMPVHAGTRTGHYHFAFSSSYRIPAFAQGERETAALV